MVSGISLANKCQLLFGFAIVVIIAVALAVPWTRMSTLMRESQIETARQLADAWLDGRVQLGAGENLNAAVLLGDDEDVDLEALMDDGDAETAEFTMRLINAAGIRPRDGGPGFLTSALGRFRDNPESDEHTATVMVNGHAVHRYARAIRHEQLQTVPDPIVNSIMPLAADETVSPDAVRAILLIDRIDSIAQGQLLTSRVFIITAGIVASLLAGLVFYFILTKLILSPVRRLRETTEKVQSGDLRIRSQIKTGDEFEQLAGAFNSMLDRLEQGQAQLKAINESLDLKLTELSEANVGLYESNRFKSEFLANVSHELRTPLNSIIGFAELLEEIAKSDAEANPKRLRYIQNILSSGRALLEMINELLDMAKIEAGRMEVGIEPTSVGDLVEGLVSIMRPQAEAKQLTLRTVIGQRLPMIETDPGKLQQILYNFLSNAIKFTPAGGNEVTISADRVTRQDNTLGVRIAVADSGPGIPYDMQDVIFEKFRQIDASHTRQHAGTGLGLAICKELAQLLGATVSFVSEPGRGATFFVDLPLTHHPHAPQPLMMDGGAPAQA